MSEVLIRCENVSKKFCRDLRRSLWYGVKESAADLFRWKKKETRNEQLDPSLATRHSAAVLGLSEYVPILWKSGS